MRILIYRAIKIRVLTWKSGLFERMQCCYRSVERICLPGRKLAISKNNLSFFYLTPKFILTIDWIDMYHSWIAFSFLNLLMKVPISLSEFEIPSKIPYTQITRVAP